MQRVRAQIGVEGITKEKLPGGSVTVAVLDTGVAAHPDLNGRVLAFHDFVKEGSRAYDDNGHGTHICGIICGSGQVSQGVYRGIAPNSRLVVGKVLDESGGGMTQNMLWGLDWVLNSRKQYDIRILNLSIGIGDLKDRRKTRALRDMVERLWDAGIVVICAAGNKGPGDNTISSVGGSGKVITVGCHDGKFCPANSVPCASYSGRGKRGSFIRKPDVVAPGTEIISCDSRFFFRDGSVRRGYTAKSGTSMATPIVSGCAALLLEKEPWLNNEQVKSRLQYSAVDLGEPLNMQGWGMINVKKLLGIS